MNRNVLPCGLALAASLLFLAVGPSSADEWKPRHDLVSHTGVMTLSEPPLPDQVFFSGPSSPADRSGWLEGLRAWRKERATLLRYNAAQYERPDLAWTQNTFSQVQVLIWDRSLYDPEKGQYTVEGFLSQTESRIGPIDAVLIWHVYPNLGVDDRNQFDMLRDLYLHEKRVEIQRLKRDLAALKKVTVLLNEMEDEPQSPRPRPRNKK